MRAFTSFTSHIQQATPPVFKGGESGLTATHADLYIIYFSHSTSNASCFQGRRERTEGNPRRILYSLLHIFNNNASCFQGRRERTEGNPCRILYSLLHIFNKRRLLFSREERANRGQSMQDFIFLTSHIQQTTLPVSKGRENELKAIHASLYIIYFSFSTNNDLLFSREEKLLREY